MNVFLKDLPEVWSWVLVAAEAAIAVAAILHVVLHKRDYRAAPYWIALIALVPVLGAVLYLLFGINIIRRRGRYYRALSGRDIEAVAGACPPHVLEAEAEVRQMRPLVESLRRLSRLPITAGNAVDILRDGDEALPAMLEAIEGARDSVALATYIFEPTGIGERFIDALARAVGRGVEVRVMVDDAGALYAWPPATGVLAARGVRVARFMPNRFVGRLLTLNLRNHRKILVVDGRTGFTGGMNIRQGTLLKEKPRQPVRDIHFRVRGPAVAQLQRMFAEDWHFCTGELLSGPRWYPRPEDGSPGFVAAVGIPDGPDEDMEIMPMALAAALAAARERVRIVTPYFLPTPPLFFGLIACALRGVDVRIATPARNNIPLVRAAARTLFPPLLERGCRIFETAPPFDHSKIFTVDGLWSCIGSTNWDPRSLRLNFEFNLACFDDQLAAGLDREFESKTAGAAEVTLDALARMPFTERVAGGIARLFIPLL